MIASRAYSQHGTPPPARVDIKKDGGWWFGRCPVGPKRGGGPTWMDVAGCGDALFHVRVDANLAQIWARNGSGRMRDGRKMDHGSVCVDALGPGFHPNEPKWSETDLMCRRVGDALR